MARPAAVLLVAALMTVSSQEFPPPGEPTIGPTNAPTPTTMMDFGSTSSGDGADDGSSWFTPTPTINSGSLNIDWTWNGSYSGSGSSGSGSGWQYYDDEAGVEIVFPGIDGAVEDATRRKYAFNVSKGFTVVTTTLNDTLGLPEKCDGSSYCVELLFESDYGAMSPFDAFVLDRYESAGGPVEFEDAVQVGGAVPLVLGRMPSADLSRSGANWSDVFNWNDTRRTSWVIRSPTKTKPIDLTLSLKQLYTLLPGYDAFNGSNATADGPFYSEDVTDQVIIRVNAHVPSLFAGDSAMLPLVVNHTGSQLFQVSMTSALLYNGSGVSGGNGMRITLAISRRKYGGWLPWFPARRSAECARCQEELSLPDAFNECLDEALKRKSLVFEDLLAFSNDRVSFDIEPFAAFCFASIANGDWTNDENATMVPMPVWNGTDFMTVYKPANVSAMAPWELLRRTDAGLRCWAESQCPIDGATLKADAQVVVLKHSPARTHIEFGQPDYSFYLQLGLENATGDETITTQVFNNWTSAEELARAIAMAFPNATAMSLDVEVRKFDNTEEIDAVEQENRRLIEQYEDALKWIGVVSRSAGGSDADAGSWSNNNSSGSSADGSSSAGVAQPQPPVLQHVPAVTYTIEIISHNVTVVPHVVAVFSGSPNVSHYSLDNSLTFEVAPLDVTKFEYVPPPPHVDLDWSEEPAWVRGIRSKNLPFFEWNDTCGECMPLYEACLLQDPDCAFGVNEYLAEALQRQRFQVTTSKMYNAAYDSWPMKYSVDISGALNQSRQFFPGGGFARFERLVNCWAATSCDLDMPRGDVVLDRGIRAAGTRFNVTESRLELLVDKAAIGYKPIAFTFPGEGRPTYWYKMMSDPVSLQQFIRDSVFNGKNESNISVWWQPATDTKTRYIVTWVPTASASSGFVFSEDPEAIQVTYTPGRVAIETVRHQPPSSVEVLPQWNRLTEWLNVFRLAPFGNRHSLNTTQGMPATPSTAICSVCSKALFNCVSSTGCMSSVSTWLPTIIGEGIDFASLKYARRFNTDALNSATSISQDHRLAAISVLQCLARNSCAAGYSGAGTSASSATTLAPTTVHMEGSFSIHVPFGSSVRLAYKSEMTDWLESGADFGAAVKSLHIYPSVSQKFVDTVNAHEYTFHGDLNFIAEISVIDLASSPASTTAMTYSGWLESPWPVLPSWEYLRKWFSPSSTDTTSGSDVCSTCLPSIQKCYNDAECWRSVQEVVLPRISSLPISKIYDEANGRTVFRAELGHVLFQDVLTSPVTNAFTSSGSWENFTPILQCFAASHCDTETMTSAIEPPATAHIPSFIYTKAASAQLYLYTDSVVQLTYRGQTYTYSETGGRSPDELSAFLKTSIGNLGVPYSVTMAPDESASNAFVYGITFGDSYLGRLPSFAVTSNGDVTGSKPPFAVLTPWQIAIESINQMPMWDKLTRLLSLVPVDPSAAPAINCEAADSYRRACLFNPTCQYMLTSGALPVIKKALETTTAVYSTVSERFEVDVTALLLSQVLPLAGTDRVAQGLLMNTIYSSTSCAGASGAVLMPDDYVSLGFDDSRVQLVRPATGLLNVEFDGQAFSIHDEDPVIGLSGLIGALTDNVGLRSQSNGGIFVAQWTIENGEIHYDIRFPRVYNVPPPHLYWHNPDTGVRIDSDDTPWRMVFRSSGYSVRDAFQPWLAWLGRST